MKKLKKLAALVLALTLSLSLCTFTPALAAEEAKRPRIYMTFEWSWTVKDTIAKNAATPDIYVHYTDVNGRNGTFEIYYPFTTDMVQKKGSVSFNSANATGYFEGFALPFSYSLPDEVVKINNITFVARNALPTFTASNIKIKFNYYYSTDNNSTLFEEGSSKDSYVMNTSNLVLFRTQTYTGTSDFVVKKNDKGRQLTLPNFKLQMQEVAPYPGGLPNNLTGSVFGEGSTALLVAGGVVLVAAFHVVMIMNRKKKEKARSAV